jgi:thymidylate synthase (FAD)
MDVKIINPQEVRELFWHWGEFAKICYDTDTNNPVPIGKGCLKSGHFSGSRSRYIEFQLTDVPRFTIDELVRHEQGVCKNVQSFRYVNKNGFNYEVPVDIKNCPSLVKDYDDLMQNIKWNYNQIYNRLLNMHFSKERAAEQARYVLPMSTLTSCSIGFTIEAFIHLCNVRLCNRAEDEIKCLVVLMKDRALDLLPDMKEYLVPQCEALLYCPEHNSCGKYLSKKEVKEIINDRNRTK